MVVLELKSNPPSRQNKALTNFKRLPCLYLFLTEFCADKDFDPVTINDLNSESISEVLINWLKEYQVNEIRRNYLPEKYSLDSSAKKYIEEFEELICKK